MRDRRVPVLFAANDLLLSLLACLLAAVILIAQPKPPIDQTAVARNAGAISVYTFWQDGINLDVDTHLSDPGGEHVFYQHPAGKVWNLLRDDMGMINDPGHHNFENAVARGTPPGEYRVNVAAYRGARGLYPANVEIEIRITGDVEQGASGQTILHRTVTLDDTGDEVTAFAFQIDANGRLVPGSVNSLYQPLARAP